MKWKYYKIEQGSWHHTFTGYFKVKVDENEAQLNKPISISFGEYIKH